MKRLSLTLICVVIAGFIIAQVPQAFSYKLQIRGNNGNVHANKKINLKISIVQNSSDGTEVYTEKHQVNTSPTGMVDIEIGRGTPLLGSFQDIEWKNWPYFIKSELDIKCSDTYKILGITELLSVPYAVYAGSAENGFTGNYDDLINKPFIPVNLSELNNDVGYIINDNDPDPTNEIQLLSISGDTVFLTSGGYVVLPSRTNGRLFYGDKDTDGYGDKFKPLWLPDNFLPPENYVLSNSDCDDDNYSVNPAVEEILTDGIDNNCDGLTDSLSLSPDKDMDGFTIALGDCNDNDSLIHPNAIEVPFDGKDQNCDGLDDEECFDIILIQHPSDEMQILQVLHSITGMSYSSLRQLIADVPVAVITCASLKKAAEYKKMLESAGAAIDIIENTANDFDKDGYTESQGDCNDNNLNIFPGNEEVCDKLDNNCNNKIDEGINCETPGAFDWRNFNNYNWLTPVKNQGNCGSCYAFASIAAFEAKIKIQTNQPHLQIDLSEQEILSCMPGSMGCNGGYAGKVLDFIISDGVCEEPCFPYTSENGIVPVCSICAGNPRKYKLESFQILGNTDINKMKQALLENGPLIVFVNLFSDFYNYEGGIIYIKNSNQSLGMMTNLIVGYNDSESYWIIRNNWGSNWGEKGHYRLAYSETDVVLNTNYTIALGNIDFDADGFSSAKGDCNDMNSAVYPGAIEICNDGIDQNCNSMDSPCTCTSGYELIDEDCIPCEAGKYKSLSGTGPCLVCPDGFYSVQQGSANCLSCQPGFTNNDQHTGCTKCPEGTYSTGGTACMSCPDGFVSNQDATGCIKKDVKSEKIFNKLFKTQ